MLVCGEGMVPSGLSFGGWQAFVFQPQNFARARHVAVLVRFGMARGVHECQNQWRRFPTPGDRPEPDVPADKTDATAGGPEDDNFLTVGIQHAFKSKEDHLNRHH